jgi:hypothetical protein
MFKGELEVCQVWKVTLKLVHPNYYFIYGKLYKFDIQSKKVSVIIQVLQMHAIMIMVFLRQKKMLVISNFDKLDSENKTYKSSIYTLPINGGTLS